MSRLYQAGCGPPQGWCALMGQTWDYGPRCRSGTVKSGAARSAGRAADPRLRTLRSSPTATLPAATDSVGRLALGLLFDEPPNAISNGARRHSQNNRSGGASGNGVVQVELPWLPAGTSLVWGAVRLLGRSLSTGRCYGACEIYGAEGGIRTHTPCGATPSRWCVCQFRHFRTRGVSFRILDCRFAPGKSGRSRHG